MAFNPKANIFQAITTKYIGPTNFRGSRVKAIAAAGTVTLHWDSALNSDANHAAAAEALATKFGWYGVWYGGGLPDSRGNCFVCTDHHGAEPAFITLRQVMATVESREMESTQ